MVRFQCRVWDGEGLAILDVCLAGGGVVFVDCWLGRKGEEVFDSAYVVAVPVSYEDC